jgi:serine/threonine protein kinase/tetratricopeptide (TPR) repeat protein
VSPEARPPVVLGPFALQARIGHGGMGEVWSGVHLAQGVPVAVKVMTAERARDPRYRTFFRREVQAVAGLDHPGIVMVFDHGEVGAEAEAASQGRLPAGSPYLAMERAGRGTLRDVRSIGWNRLKPMLLALLDALAHAHARRVVHRDLKPSNVLLFELGAAAARGPDPASPAAKLADFGVAYTADHDGHSGEGELVSGTPHYMAPEQIVGAWRDYGPWTDLYALGCVAYEMISGAPPFGAGDVLSAKLHAEAPSLQPRMPVPPLAEGWIGRLLQLDPVQRFRTAADAARSLRLLPDVDDDAGGELQLLEHRTDPDVDGRGPVPLDEAPTSHFLRYGLSGSRAAGARPDLAARGAPPLPSHWEREQWQGGSRRLLGVGLGLYGLRSIPLVGRRPERDALWRTLVEVREAGRARLVLLQGSAGCGKTRLAEWIAERAHEVGGAVALKAVHGPLPSPGDGLARMIAHLLGCAGLSRSETQQRLERLLRAQGIRDPGEWHGLTELVAPDEASQATSLSPVERHGLVRRALGRIARERPVVVLLDDVQWGSEALDFCADLLANDAREPLPALLLLTARDEALAERAMETAQLAELTRRPGTTRLTISPLPPPDHSALVHQLLGLEGELAAQVEERTAGVPLFAVQLVGDWVQRGVLEPASSGFRLRAGEHAVLPDDLHQVWLARLRLLLDAQAKDAGPALELAAALGPVVDPEEWERACLEAGLRIPIGLDEALISRRLALPADPGWSFVHGMLRESLVRLSREQGRWAALSRACARMLSYGTGRRGVAERLGRHLLQAGEPASALEPLLRGARERRETSDYRVAQGLLAEREAALESLGLPVTDRHWGEGWVLRARVLLHQGRLGDATREAQRAAQGAGPGWEGIEAEALRLLGDVARRRGDLAGAQQLYARCVALLPRLDNPHGVAASLWGLGDVARQQGRLQEAAAQFDASRSLYERIGDRHGLADHRIGLADVAWQRGELRLAGDQYAVALGLFQRLGNRYGAARCLNGLGEVARQEGQLSRAEDHYRRSQQILETILSAEAVFPRVNLGLTALAAGRYDDARAGLEPSLRDLEALGWQGASACAGVALAACAGQRGDWSAWDRLAGSFGTLRQQGLVEPDAAWCAELAGDLALQRGERGRAQQAYALALEQWRLSGNEERASRVSAALGRL